MDIYQANENQNATTTTEEQQPMRPARGQLQLQKLDWEELEAVVGGLEGGPDDDT